MKNIQLTKTTIKLVIGKSFKLSLLKRENDN